MGSLNHKENKFLTSSIKKSLNSAIYEKKSHDTIVSSRKKLASQKLNESLSSPSSISSSSSSINSCASSHSESGQKSKNRNKCSNKEKSIRYDSNDKTSKKKVLVEMTNDKNKIADIDAMERLANKTVFDRIKKFTHSSSTIENPLTHPSLPTLSSDFNSKLNRFINSNSKSSMTTRVESSERRKGKNSITINNKLADFPNDSNNFQDERSQTSHANSQQSHTCDEIKIESNKVKEIIKSFNNIEKRTSTNLNLVNSNTDPSNVKQNVSQTPKSTNHIDIGESPIPFAKLDTQLDTQSLNSKFITKNLNKTTLSGNFSQNGNFHT